MVRLNFLFKPGSHGLFPRLDRHQYLLWPRPIQALQIIHHACGIVSLLSCSTENCKHLVDKCLACWHLGTISMPEWIDLSGSRCPDCVNSNDDCSFGHITVLILVYNKTLTTTVAIITPTSEYRKKKTAHTYPRNVQKTTKNFQWSWLVSSTLRSRSEPPRNSFALYFSVWVCYRNPVFLMMPRCYSNCSHEPTTETGVRSYTPVPDCATISPLHIRVLTSEGRWMSARFRLLRPYIGPSKIKTCKWKGEIFYKVSKLMVPSNWPQYFRCTDSGMYVRCSTRWVFL